MYPKKVTPLDHGRVQFQRIDPRHYNCLWEISNFSEMFPNVFEEPFATSKSIEEKFQMLKPPDPCVPTEINLTLSTFRDGSIAEYDENAVLSAFIRAELLPASRAPNENDRILISFMACHFKTECLLRPTYLTVDVVGRHSNKSTHHPQVTLFTGSYPPLSNWAFPGVARGVEWKVTLADLWNMHERMNYKAIIINDKIRIRIELKYVCSEKYIILPESVRTFTTEMLDLLESGENSDFTIKCGSQEFKVHGLILRKRSPVFKAMLSYNLQEKERREVNITDIEPSTLKLLLHFLYSAQVEPAKLDFQQVYELIYAADKYQIIELKNSCLNYLSQEVNLDNIEELTIIIYDHSPPQEAQKRLRDFVFRNWKSIESIPDLKNTLEKYYDIDLLRKEQEEEEASATARLNYYRSLIPPEKTG